MISEKIYTWRKTIIGVTKNFLYLCGIAILIGIVVIPAIAAYDIATYQGINIRNFPGISGNTLGNATASVTSGSKITTISGLSSSDVGKLIQFMKLGTTSEFQSSIVSVSGSTVTIADNATFSGTSIQAYYGSRDTTFIDLAAASAKFLHTCIYVASSNTGNNAVGGYWYDGSGIDWDRPCIFGDGMINSVIDLGVGKSFFAGGATTAILTGLVHDIGFTGGKSPISSIDTNSNVHVQFKIDHVNFLNYSGAAITFNYSDFPEVQIIGSEFNGLNSIQSMGVAMASCGPCFFDNNGFGTNRFHYKLGAGEFVIDGNDFVQGSGEATPGSYVRANVWIVPSSASNTIGPKIINSKFGSENLDNLDVRILISDTVASSGSNFFGDTLPTGTASTGFVQDLISANNSVNGSSTTGSGSNPIVYSYTPNFTHSIINGTLNGTYPGYIVQWDSSILPLSISYQANNVFGPFNMQGNGTVAPNSAFIQVTNAAASIGTLIDPNGDFSYNDSSVVPYLSRGATIVTNLLTTKINAFGFPSGSSHSQITDSAGGTDAVTYTSSNPNDQIIGDLSTTPANGSPNWCYAELRQGSSGTPATSVSMAVVDAFGTPKIQSKIINLRTNWIPYILSWSLQQQPAHTPPHIVFFTNSGTATGATVDIGRVICYTSQQPTSGSAFLLPTLAPYTTLKAAAFSTFPTCASAFEGTHISVIDSSTTTYGATITGSSTGHVHGYCNGTNWVVD